MKVALNKTFVDLDGKQFGEIVKDAEGKESIKYLTMGHVLRVAAASELPEDGQGNGQEVLDRKIRGFDFQATMRDAINAGKITIDLSAEDVVYIKPRIAKLFHVMVAIPAVRHLEGKDGHFDNKASEPAG